MWSKAYAKVLQKTKLLQLIKVLLHIHEERTGKKDLWSLGVVKTLSEKPAECNSLLELFYESDVINQYYKR